MQRITPFLWFDTQAEEAAKFYCSIFEDSKVTAVTRCGDAGPGPKGSVLTCAFQLQGQDFVALNGGPRFPFTEAVSFVVNCETQVEIDTFWDKLCAGGGQPSMCGWLKDKYGVSWQIVPTVLGRILQDKDSQRVNRAMEAMLQMRKLDIAALERAFGR